MILYVDTQCLMSLLIVCGIWFVKTQNTDKEYDGRNDRVSNDEK